MNSIGNTSPTVQAMSEIEEAMSCINCEIDRALDRLQNLHMRLGTLMSPSAPSEKLAAVQGGPSSAFGQSLENQAQRLRQINNSLSDLLARIQL